MTEAHDRTTTVRWDSAGITIVEPSEPAWESGSEVTVSTSPSLSFSTLEGSPQPALYGIVDALERRDGQIVAAEHHRFFIFDQHGQLVLEKGGEGEGPGEFRNIQSIILLANDSIAIFDASNQRISVYDQELSRVRDVMNISEGLVRDVLAIRGDTIVAVFDRSSDADLPSTGTFRIPIIVGLLTGEENIGDLWQGLGTEIQVLEYGEGTVQVRSLFSQGTSFAVHDGALYASHDSRVGFSVVRDGRIQQQVRLRGVDLSLSGETIEREREALLGPNPSPVQVQLMSQLDDPRERSASSAIAVDPTGLIWMQQHRGWSERGEPIEWWIFSDSGEWLGEIVGPERFTPLQIGKNHIIGVFHDFNDVEHLQIISVDRQ